MRAGGAARGGGGPGRVGRSGTAAPSAGQPLPGGPRPHTHHPTPGAGALARAPTAGCCAASTACPARPTAPPRTPPRVDGTARGRHVHGRTLLYWVPSRSSERQEDSRHHRRHRLGARCRTPCRPPPRAIGLPPTRRRRVPRRSATRGSGATPIAARQRRRALWSTPETHLLPRRPAPSPARLMPRRSPPCCVTSRWTGAVAHNLFDLLARLVAVLIERREDGGRRPQSQTAGHQGPGCRRRRASSGWWRPSTSAMVARWQRLAPAAGALRSGGCSLPGWRCFTPPRPMVARPGSSGAPLARLHHQALVNEKLAMRRRSRIQLPALTPRACGTSSRTSPSAPAQIQQFMDKLNLQGALDGEAKKRVDQVWDHSAASASRS